MSSFRADDFLEKMDTKDPDFRYMAVEDLLKECQKPDFKMDAKVEPKIVAKIVYMIGNDSSGDVKSVAMKCISPLANKVSDEQFKAIVDGLSQIIFVLKSSSTPETQDISTMALKAILVECAESKGDYFVADLAPKLTDNITKPKTPETVWFCLDLQNDILGRWGRQMSAQGQTSKLLTAVLPHLTSDNNRARNKAIGCLGYICFSLPEAQLNDLISKLLSQAKSSKKKEHLRAYMMAIAAVCRSADRGRVAQHLNNILPVVLGNIDNQQEDFQDDEELKDNSLQGLEALLNRCPKEIDASFAKVQATCLKFISWDPILVQVDEEDGDTVVADDADAFVDDGDDGLLLGDSDEVVDDEDSSWKVRKAATRCVFSIIRTRPDKLTQIFEEILPVLIKRFTEREESVKLDVMAVVGEILREAEHIIRAEKDSKTSQTILAKLAVVAPQIYKSAVKELTSKSPKSKVSGFQLLKELASVAPGAFTDSNFVEGVTLALVPSSSSPLKIQALEFLRAVVNPQTAPSFLDKLGELTKSIYVAVNDVYYKVVAEALRVVSQLIKTISSVSGQDAHASDLFSAILPKLKLTDVDLEVKDTAIEAAGLLVSLLGSKLKPAQVEECFAIFQTRLANELTRINSIKTISQTARAKVPLGNVLGDTVKALAGFLNKTNRLLIQVSLIALFDIISGPDGQSKPATSHYEQLLKDLSILLEGQDLQLAHLGLQVVKAVLHANGGLSGSAVNLILPKTNVLLVQPTFQGPALHSLVSVFEELGKAGNPEKLVDGLSKLAVGDLPKSSIHAVAQCIAAAVSANAQGREAVLATFIKNIADGKDENQKLLALYVTGEIGSKTDITGAANLAKNVLAAFDASSVELKSAASVSFGCVCSQNISKFLEELKASPQRKFLLLGSLREIIVRLSASPEGKTVINPHFDHLLGTLLEQTAHEDEDTRNIVSECLGKLTSINPEAVVVALSKRTSDSNSHTKSCVTTALKFSITDKPQPVDAILASNVNVFLNLLNDKEVKVRHAVVGSLLQSAHAKPSIIRDSLTEFLPVIYDQTRIRPELIKEIECGPIKHKIDEGLETRQATFELMFTLLETCLSRLELQAFIQKLVSGLADEYDIQLLNHQIIIRLAKNAKSALVAGLEQLLAPLTLCVNSVPKDANNAEQVEKTTTLIRSAMRAIAAVNHIPDVADTCPQFQEFMKSKILGVEKLAKVYAEVTK